MTDCINILVAHHVPFWIIWCSYLINCSSVNLLGWNWTLSGSSASFVVFDISSKSFQILFFQFPFLPGNDNKHRKERRKIFWIEFLKELLLQKGIWIGRVLFTFSAERNNNREFFKLHQKYLIFLKQRVWWDFS